MFFKHEFSTLQRAKVPRRDKNRTKRHKAQALYNSRLMSPTPSKSSGVLLAEVLGLLQQVGIIPVPA